MVRALAINEIEIRLGNAEPAERTSVPDAKLSPEDRGLFNELTQGCLREWRYLEWVIAKFSKTTPSRKFKPVIALGAYQLLFLDRVPAYAVFSETAAIAKARGAVEQEGKYIHAVLKQVERERESLLEAREQALECARLGQYKSREEPLVLAVLNAEAALVDALTVPELANAAALSKGAARKETRTRALRALAAMKERLPLVGYIAGDISAKSTSRDAAASLESSCTPLASEIAPRALSFEGGPEFAEDLEAGRIRIQGEASQWACEVALQELERLNSGAGVAGRPGGTLRVLEMSAGKGGKLLGTLAAGWPKDAPLEWYCVDPSPDQLDILLKTTLPLVRKHWPKVSVEIICYGWQNGAAGFRGPQAFDFVWLDAPCTGFGTLAKLPEIALIRGENAYQEAMRLALLQENLAEVGCELLAPGGAFLYSVCTLTRPETVGVSAFLSKTLGREPRLSKALWPGEAPAPHAEGFFLALY